MHGSWFWGVFTELMFPALFVLILSQNWFRFDRTERFELDKISNNIALNLCLVLQVSILIGLSHNSPRIGILLLFIIGLGRLIYIRQLKNNSAFFFYGLLPVTLLSLWGKFPWLANSISRSGGRGIWATWNLDVISWAAIVNEYLISGYGPSGHLAGVNTYTYNSEAPMIPIFGSAVSTVFNLRSWESASIAMSAAFVITVLMLAAFVKEVFQGLTQGKCLIISTTVMSSAYMNYIYNSQFFSQIIAIGVFCFTAKVCIQILRLSKIEFEDWIYLSVLVPLNVYTYPVLLIPHLFIWLMIVAIGFMYKQKTLWSRTLMQFIISIGVGIVLSFPILLKSIEQMRFIANVNAGWRLDLVDPITWIFSNRYLLSGVRASIITNLSLWTVFAFLLVILSKRYITESKNRFPVLMLFAYIVLVITYLIYENDLSSYQSWKFISFITPIVLVVSFAMLVSLVKKIWYAAPLLLGLCLNPFSYLSVANNSANYVTAEMVSLSEHPYLKSFTSVNFSTSPGWQNMMLSIMTEGIEINTVAADLWMKEPDQGAPTVLLRSQADGIPVEPLVGQFVISIPNK